MSKHGKVTVNPRSSTYIDNLIFKKTTNQQSLENEAHELERCKKLNLRTHHIIPTEFEGFEKDSNTLSTKLIDGKELFHILWNSTYLLGKLRGNRLPNINILLDRFNELGQWLRLYHDSSISSDGYDAGLEWISEDILRKIEYIENNKLLKKDKIKRILRYTESLYKELERSTLQSSSGLFQCRVHADFIVYNILVDKELDFHVLDFSDVRLGCCLDDVVRFYSGLYAMSRTNRMRNRVLGNLLSTFLSGYGYSPEITSHPYFKLVMLYNFLIQFCVKHNMRNMHSFVSRLEVSSITRVGHDWIKSQLPR